MTLTWIDRDGVSECKVAPGIYVEVTTTLAGSWTAVVMHRDYVRNENGCVLFFPTLEAAKSAAEAEARRVILPAALALLDDAAVERAATQILNQLGDIGLRRLAHAALAAALTVEATDA